MGRMKGYGLLKGCLVPSYCYLIYILDMFFYGIVIGMLSLGTFLLGLAYGDFEPGLGPIALDCNHAPKDPSNTDCNLVFSSRAAAFYLHCFLLLVHGYNCRFERKTVFAKKIFENKYLNWSVLLGLVLVIPTAYLGFPSEQIFAQSPFAYFLFKFFF